MDDAHRRGRGRREANRDSTAPRGIRRRDALSYGLLGAAGVLGVGTVVVSLRGGDQAEAGGAPLGESEVFKGGAPDASTFASWKQRGWAREAMHYDHDGQSVVCRICPNECRLDPGDRGRCRNKVAIDGKLYTMAFANPCSIHVDPVEKKPLFHFLPGTLAYSLATAGCNFRCLNCQNWEISQKTPEETKSADGAEVRLTLARPHPSSRSEMNRASLFPEDLVQIAQGMGCSSVAYTYTEPISFYEYMLESGRLARRARVKNVWVTNGYINPGPLDELCEVIDGANVDLKSFSEDVYAALNSGRLQPVLDGLKQLKQRGVWFEVTNLVVPRHTDDLQQFRRMADWMVHELGPDVPLHISRFHPQYRLDRLPPTPVQTLISARRAALEAGLHYVYVGNVRGVQDAATTFCPGCKQAVIERDVYQIRTFAIDRGKCTHCGAAIAGVWQV